MTGLFSPPPSPPPLCIHGPPTPAVCTPSSLRRCKPGSSHHAQEVLSLEGRGLGAGPASPPPPHPCPPSPGPRLPLPVPVVPACPSPVLPSPPPHQVSPAPPLWCSFSNPTQCEGCVAVMSFGEWANWFSFSNPTQRERCVAAMSFGEWAKPHLWARNLMLVPPGWYSKE